MLAVDVDGEAVQEWFNREPGSPSRLHKLSQCLTGAMLVGVRRGVIEALPWAELTLPREKAHEPIFLDTDQVRAIADACHGWGTGRKDGTKYVGWYGPLVWFLATTGVRISEALAMDVRHIVRRRVGGQDVWRGRVTTSKGGVSRDVPVPPKVVRMLDLSRPKDAPLFVTPLGVRVAKDNWRARAWRAALEEAKLHEVGLRPHDLRHTAISWAIADGADIKAVQRMAGHKSAKTTFDVYGHLWDAGLDDVASRMDARLG